MEEREQTLLEWYERSLIDCSTFDAESRQEIQSIVDDSEDVFGSEQEIREFFTRAIEAFEGSVEKRGNQLYEAEVPPEVTNSGQPETMGPFTFSRDFAIDHDGIEYLSPTRMFYRLSVIWFSSRNSTQGRPERSCCRSSTNPASHSSTKSPSKMQPARRFASSSFPSTSTSLDLTPSVHSASVSLMQKRFTPVQMRVQYLGYSSNGTTLRTPLRGTSVVWSPISAKIARNPSAGRSERTL